jgi:hypothetical protein
MAEGLSGLGVKLWGDNVIQEQQTGSYNVHGDRSSITDRGNRTNSAEGRNERSYASAPA